MPDPVCRSVLFVCWGNICRSPTAEGVMQQLLIERGLSETVRVDSAGTIDYHAGNPADYRMQEAARRRGYQLTSVSRQVEPADFERFDLIIAMDRKNLGDLRAIDPGVPDKVRLFSEFLPAGSPPDVPDPYLGEAGFDRVIAIVEHGCPGILDHLIGG